MFTKSVHLLVPHSSRAASHLLALFIVLSLLVGGCDAGVEWLKQQPACANEK